VEDDNDMDGGEESGSLKQQGVDKIPTLYEIAKGNTSKYNLDDKQYIAYQIVCCTFLLQLVTEGDQYDTKLGDMLGATLGPLNENVQRTKDSLVRDLKAKGGKDQLIMFITGQAGCGKSTTMEAAQFYCHKFCSSIAAAFNDYTFYFTATTGSAAALFGGTTIHSAAHLDKSRINDEMRAVWRDDVRILIIDEISFFKASDVVKLDRQLKKLTGRYDAVYGGVSVVFSGDFHQLKPICAEDDVLYSDSDAASIWDRGERTRGVTSGARQEFCRNFFTMAEIGHRQFGVRNSPLLQLILCYYLLSRVETLGRHRRGYGLCRPRVWSPQVHTRWRFSCKRH
jgi:hypothetical protein